MIFLTTTPFSGILDIYGGNDFNPQKCWNAGIRLVIHKAGEWNGMAVENQPKLYQERKAAWDALGGLWGNYFLPFASSSPAEMFAAWMACDPNDPLVMRAIDWESDGSDTATQDQIRQLAQMFENHFGYLPILYGSNTLTEMKPDSVLSACLLWYANPNGGNLPTTFAPRHPPEGRVIFWQFTEDGDELSDEFDGADFNAYDGDLKALQFAFPSFDAPVKTSLASHSEDPTGALPG